MAFDYDAPENHLRARNGLSPEIQATLLGGLREAWPKHPRFGGLPAFWMEIHRGLLGGGAQTARILRGLTETPVGDLAEAVSATRIRETAAQLVAAAHHHHHIEDDHYFPQFAYLSPQLERGLRLLDGDHHVLDEALSTMEHTAAALAPSLVDRDQVGAALKAAEGLEGLLRRHLWDEEEVIIPLLLQSA